LLYMRLSKKMSKRAERTSEVYKDVRDFYDGYGWKSAEKNDCYQAEVLHEHLNETARAYMKSNEMRYSKYYGDGGRLFLDAGCGAEPRREMSSAFAKCVCADVSLVGLKESRKKLKDSGLYVVADLAALPFKKKSFDGILVSHCVYHIDKDLQPLVIRELYKLAKPEKTILIFYASNRNLVSVFQAVGIKTYKLVMLLLRLVRRKRVEDEKTPPPLYYYIHNPFKLTRAFDEVDITCLRILTRWETTALAKLKLLKLVVPLLSFLERKFPHLMLYIGKYVTIRIRAQ